MKTTSTPLPPGALVDHVRMGSFTATDGATVEYFTHGDPAALAFLVSPAFTGSARLYAERFGHALPGYFVVVVQLRGHGHGGGCTFDGATYCTPEQGPADGTYQGFRMARLGADLRDARANLGLGKVALMGHSLGMNVVSEFLSNFGTQDITGLFVYDESPKNFSRDVVLPEDDTFPPDVAVFPVANFAVTVQEFAAYRSGSGYYQVPKTVRQLMGGDSGNPVYNPETKEPAFVLTEAAWDLWAPFADRMNGKILSLLFWSSITNDYTDVYRLVRESGMPVLVYGGKVSLVPWQAMQWVHEQLPGSEFMLFDENVGVHASFLNPPPSGDEFMDRLRHFLDQRVRPRA